MHIYAVLPLASAVRTSKKNVGNSLFLEDMRIYGFNMDELGGAIYLNHVNNLFVDNQTVFRNNINSDTGVCIPLFLSLYLHL